jgi:intracellular sulfur oxidation DsrE/DsrF family protein
MKMVRILIVLAGLLASGAVLAADEAIKAVYHLVDGQAQSTRAMANIRNHLDADPTVNIVVVAHGAGIDFLLEGAMDAKGQAFAGPIGELANRGVKFRVCNNTLVTRGVPKDRVVMEASIVPSGVAEIARLQAREGFAYVRP